MVTEPKSLKLIIRQGSTYREDLPVVDSDGSPFDLTGWSARAKIRQSYSTDKTLFNLTSDNLGISIDAQGGIVSLLISADASNFLKPWRHRVLKAVYDLEIENDTTGQIVQIFNGRVEIIKNITRDESRVPPPSLINIDNDPVLKGLVTQIGPGQHTVREINASTEDIKLGLVVKNSSGILGDIVIGLNIDGLDVLSNVASDDQLVVFDANGLVNRKVSIAEATSLLRKDMNDADVFLQGQIDDTDTVLTNYQAAQASQRTSDLANQATADQEQDDRVDALDALRVAEASDLVSYKLDAATALTTAQATLNAQIIGDRQARIAADQTINATIAQNESDRDSELSLLENQLASDQAVQDSALATEVADRQAAVTAEATSRSDADAVLQTTIVAETSNRQAAITAEAASRSSAITALQADIATEATSRAGADAVLQSDIDSRVSLAGDESIAGVKTFSDDVVISGGLTIAGDVTTTNSSSVEIGDSILVLNYDETGHPSQDAGLRIERGTSPDVFIGWDEGEDAFKAGLADGSKYKIILENDSRLTDSRTAKAHNHVASNVTAGQFADGRISTSSVVQHQSDLTIVESQISDLKNYALQSALTTQIATREPKFAKKTAFNKDFGNTSGTVTQGNDARLSDARTPTAHDHNSDYLKLTGGTLTDVLNVNNDINIFHAINNAVLRINANANNRNAIIVFESEGVANSYITGNPNSLTLRFVGGNTTSTLQQYEDKFQFNKPVESSASTSLGDGGNTLSTKSYVDDHLKLTGGDLSGLLSISGAVAQLQLNDENGAIRGQLYSNASQVVINKSGGSQLTLTDNAIFANRIISGVTPAGSSHLTTKSYVDDYSVPKSGGNFTGNIAIFPDSDSSTTYLTFRNNTTNQGNLIGVNNRFVLRRPNPSGTDTDIDLYFDRVEVNKKMLGVSSTESNSFTTKSYVDEHLKLSGGSLTGDLRHLNESVLRFGKFQDTHKVVLVAPPAASGNVEIEMQTSTNFKNRISSNPSTTESWTMQLPPTRGTPGQVMRVASLVGEVMTMEWYTP